MSSFGTRPHFSQTLDIGLERAQSRIIEEVHREDSRFEVKSFPGFICVRIPEAERHFWSPRLNLSLESDDAGGTRVEGVYGPNANVWSLFLYGYLITGSAAIFGGSIGFAQWSLGKTAWGLWIFWFSLAVAAGLYLLAQFGQKVGAQQTFRLHQLYETAIGRTVQLR